MYSSRLKKILTILLSLPDGQYIKIDDLAEKIQASRRTVFRELKDIDLQLSDTGCRCESRQGKGIRLIGTEEQRNSLKEALRVTDVPYTDKTERQRLLTYELLQEEEIRKLIYYANMFQVSEATISNDLDAVETWLSDYDLHLDRSVKSRLTIRGREARKREAMAAIVREQILETQKAYSDTGLEDPASLETLLNGSPGHSILRLLDQDLVRSMVRLFSRYRHELGLDTYAQSSYMGLIIHLVVAVERIRQNEPMEASSQLIAIAQEEETYAKAARIAECIENELDIEIPPAEVSFIAFHLKGAKAAYQKTYPDSRDPQLHRIIDRMILQYDREVAFHLSHDEQYLNGLIAHLEPVLLRLEYQMPIYNPLVEQLKKQYPDLFEQSRRAAAVLEQEVGFPVGEEEIGFLTMHAGASLERNTPAPIFRKVEIGVVCASGIGISALLAARIRNAFSHEAKVRTLSLSDLSSNRFYSSEFLISTFDLKNVPLPVVRVSALLSQKDIQNIQHQIDLRKNIGVEQKLDDLSEFHQKLIFMNQASTAALQIMERFAAGEIPASCDTRQLIHLAAGQLEGDPVQLEKDLLAREQLGSILSEEYGFVMFHAATSGTQFPQFCLMYPDADTFSDPGLKGIQVALTSVIPDPYTREEQEMVSAISSALIDNEGFYSAILSRDDLSAAAKLCEVLQTHIQNKF